MTLKIKKTIVTCFLIVFLVFSVVAGACAYSSILAFGDSLSDNGYYEGYYGGTPGNTNPADTYGFQRFSDGPVWVEYLASSYGLSLMDMAYGGATSGWDNPAAGLPIYGLQWQVDTYIDNFGTISSDTLITVWAGGNDMLNYASDPLLYNPLNAAANVALAIQTLINEGGANFIVPNLSWAYIDPSLQAGAQSWIQPFNMVLAVYLENLDAIPGINIYAIDLTQLSYTGLNPNGSVTNPDGEEGPFARYDSIHPSTAGHQQIAAYIVSQVPEPATVILLIISLAGLAGVRKRMR